MIFRYGRCTTGQHGASCALGISRIGFTAQPPRRTIRAVNLEDFDTVVSQKLRQAGAVGGRALDAGAAEIAERPGPVEKLKVADSSCTYSLRSDESSGNVDHCADVFVQVGIDPKYDFVLIHLNVPSKMIMATPTSTAGQDTQGAEQSSYKVTCAEPDGARGTSDLVDRSTRRHQGQS